ncbi:MAG: PD40 domain-containing protein [Salinivirgaceae bacterium]|nr:PD40 domain-containing protein [Salinivirgaceae bacterium]
MIMKRIYMFAVALACSVSAFAQDIPFDKNYFQNQKDAFKVANTNFKDGESYFSKEFYYEALQYYLEAQTFNPSYSTLNYRIGVCYMNLPMKYKSLQYFEKAYQLRRDVAEDIHLMLARAYHLNGEFDKAIGEYKAHMAVLKPTDAAEMKPQLEKYIAECECGKQLMDNPARAFIDNAGSVLNSRFNDHSPLISADESMMIFTSTRNNGRTMSLEDGQYDEDIYISVGEKKNWQVPNEIGEPINTQFDDATVGLFPDGQQLLIYNGRKGNGDIEQCSLKGLKWEYPKAMPKTINSEYRETSACFSPDGRKLYFVSDRPGGFGGSDIYVSTRTDKDKWSEAVNLGPIINTQYDEEAVFMHPDGRTLYFSSRGHNTMGGYDIFMSQMDNIGNWSEPVNLGYPINSPDNDLCFVISANGRHGYCSSVRPEGSGGLDIYRMTFLGPEKPYTLSGEDNLISARSQPVSDMVMEASVELVTIRLTIVKGVVRDAISNEPLAANIDIVDNEKNEVIFTSQTNSATGKFLVSLPSGKNYGLMVKADNYLFHSENFNIPAATEYQEIEKDIALNNIKKDVKIILKNVFFETGSAKLKPTSYAELGRLTKLLSDMPSMRIEISGHTDNQGSKATNQRLSEARAKSVVDFLISEGVDASRLEYKGYAFDQPVADNSTKEGRAMNRRVEFKVLSTE